MVMSSAIKSGAVSIPKSVSPVSSAPPSPTTSPFASNLSYRLLNVSEVSDSRFFNVGLQLSAEHVVFFYAVQKASRIGCNVTPVTDRAFVVPGDAALYFEASCPVTQRSKESLTSLLDMADDAACSRVFALVPKDGARLKDIVSSYAACGFALSRESQSGSHIVLQFDI